MSAYERQIGPPEKSWKYLLFAAEPYETIALKNSLQSICCVAGFQCHAIQNRSKSKQHRSIDKVKNLGNEGGKYAKALAKIQDSGQSIFLI